MGHFAKRLIFLVAYISHVWLVLHKAVKRNNFPLHTECIHRMPGLFLSYDGNNYTRTILPSMISSIEITHPGAKDALKREAFRVARSMFPGRQADVDKTMEETFMKN